MATTLSSNIVEIDIPRLKRELESIPGVRVKNITPPMGGLAASVVLAGLDGVSSLNQQQQDQALQIIQDHQDGFDESKQETAKEKTVIGTLKLGKLQFTNNGVCWEVNESKDIVPVGEERNLGSPTAYLNRVYVREIVGPGGEGAASIPGSAEIYNEIPEGDLDGENQTFYTLYNFGANSTRVFLNGLRLCLGAGRDYIESGSDRITLTTPPGPGDILFLDYKKVE